MGAVCKEVTTQAAGVLNNCQAGFEFVVPEATQHLPEPDLDGVYSWNLLTQRLLEEKKHQRAPYLIGVLDAPIENNWFSVTCHEQDLALITTAERGGGEIRPVGHDTHP